MSALELFQAEPNDCIPGGTRSNLHELELPGNLRCSDDINPFIIQTHKRKSS